MTTDCNCYNDTLVVAGVARHLGVCEGLHRQAPGAGPTRAADGEQCDPAPVDHDDGGVVEQQEPAPDNQQEPARAAVDAQQRQERQVDQEQQVEPVATLAALRAPARHAGGDRRAPPRPRGAGGAVVTLGSLVGATSVCLVVEVRGELVASWLPLQRSQTPPGCRSEDELSTLSGVRGRCECNITLVT